MKAACSRVQTHMLEEMLDFGAILLQQALLALHQKSHKLFLCTGKTKGEQMLLERMNPLVFNSYTC